MDIVVKFWTTSLSTHLKTLECIIPKEIDKSVSCPLYCIIKSALDLIYHYLLICNHWEDKQSHQQQQPSSSIIHSRSLIFLSDEYLPTRLRTSKNTLNCVWIADQIFYHWNDTISWLEQEKGTFMAILTNDKRPRSVKIFDSPMKEVSVPSSTLLKEKSWMKYAIALIKRHDILVISKNHPSTIKKSPSQNLSLTSRYNELFLIHHDQMSATKSFLFSITMPWDTKAKNCGWK